jgi:hypothetical protein
VTAKIRWLSRAIPNLDDSYEEGRPRWIHCTPLLGQSGAVGVWMIVLIDEDRYGPSRRFRQAPPIANDLRGRKDGGRNRLDDYDDLDFDGHGSRTALRNEVQAHGPGSARHVTMDSHRQPSSPHNTAPTYEQRSMRSATSIRDYGLGHNRSTDTFDI